MAVTIIFNSVQLQLYFILKQVHIKTIKKTKQNKIDHNNKTFNLKNTPYVDYSSSVF